MLGVRSFEGDVAGGHRGADQVSAALDAVGDHPMAGAVERVDALHFDHLGAGTGDARPHRGEQAREVRDLGLAGAVLEPAGAARQRRRHEQVLGAGDGGAREAKAGGGEPRRFGVHVSILQSDRGSHGLEAEQVLIDRSHADGAASGQRDSRVTATGEQRPENEHAGAHGLHHVVRRIVEAGGARRREHQRLARRAELRAFDTDGRAGGAESADREPAADC